MTFTLLCALHNSWSSSYLTCQQHLAQLSLLDTLSLLDFSPFHSFLNGPSQFPLEKERKKTSPYPFPLDVGIYQAQLLVLLSSPFTPTLLGHVNDSPNLYLQPMYYFSQNSDSAFYLHLQDTSSSTCPY